MANARGVRHQLAHPAFDQAGDEEHEHGPHRKLRRRPAMARGCRRANTGPEQHVLRDHKAAGAAQDDGAELGDAVDRNPSEEVHQQVAIVMQAMKAPNTMPDRRAASGSGCPPRSEPEHHDADQLLCRNRKFAKVMNERANPGHGAKISRAAAPPRAACTASAGKLARI